MNEELLQRDLIKNPPVQIGTWNFYNIRAICNVFKEANIIRSIDYGDVSRKKVDAIITRQKVSNCNSRIQITKAINRPYRPYKANQDA